MARQQHFTISCMLWSLGPSFNAKLYCELAFGRARLRNMHGVCLNAPVQTVGTSCWELPEGLLLRPWPAPPQHSFGQTDLVYLLHGANAYVGSTNPPAPLTSVCCNLQMGLQGAAAWSMQKSEGTVVPGASQGSGTSTSNAALSL